MRYNQVLGDMPSDVGKIPPPLCPPESVSYYTSYNPRGLKTSWFAIFRFSFVLLSTV